MLLAALLGALCGCGTHGPGEASAGAQSAAAQPAGTPPAETPPAETPQPGMGDIGEIAWLCGLEADVQSFLDMELLCVVDTAGDHNPYDVEWRYGAEYNAYVEALDAAGMWDILFDADFYMNAFPMLAMLYHYDEALLLQHFQTVGIHEGRQASEQFSVAAYMDSCDSALRDAFGDSYECYYFYWALNQSTQRGVKVTGDGYPLQLTAKMTSMQYIEFTRVNEYRAAAGAGPVIFDPELAAWACYRAWVDLDTRSAAHDWLNAHTDEGYEVMDLLCAGGLSENAVHTVREHRVPDPCQWYREYYNSPAHYEAMVDPANVYFGCSNMYCGGWDGGYIMGVEYDVYTTGPATACNPKAAA